MQLLPLTAYSSAGLMPTEARGNYFPEPLTYARQRPITASHSSRHDALAIISSRYQYSPFLFFVAEVMSNYSTADGLKNFLYFRRHPLRPEARGICHIYHMVNPTLAYSDFPLINAVMLRRQTTLSNASKQIVEQ